MGYFDQLKEMQDEEVVPRRQRSGAPAARSSAGRRHVLSDIIPPTQQRTTRPTSFPPKRPAPRAPKGAEQRTKPEARRTARMETRPESPLEPESGPGAPLGGVLPDIEVGLELPIRTWEPEATRKVRLKWRIGIATVASLAALGFLLPTAVFPKFSITIFPKRERASIGRVDFVADTSLSRPDPAGRKVPALAITSEKVLHQEYDATGTKFVQERARGSVTIFNAFDSSSQVLPANTRLQTTSGKVFRLTATVRIPGAKITEGKIVPTSVAATVSADAPGDTFNIGPTDFRFPDFRGTPKYQGLYAKSDQTFAGGICWSSEDC